MEDAPEPRPRSRGISVAAKAGALLASPRAQAAKGGDGAKAQRLPALAPQAPKLSALKKPSVWARVRTDMQASRHRTCGGRFFVGGQIAEPLSERAAPGMVV